MRRPDSLNLVIKTWYYVSWGSNKYHQLYPVLIEQNKNLLKLFFRLQNFVLKILFLSLSPVHWYSNGGYQLQIWVFSIKRFSRIVPKLKPENINMSKIKNVPLRCPLPDLCFGLQGFSTISFRAFVIFFYCTTFCDWIKRSEIDWILRWRMFSQARQSNSKEITTYTHFLAIKQMRTSD